METNFDKFSHKTRVLVLSKDASLASLLVHVLNFNGKAFDVLPNRGELQNSNHDFIIFETADVEQAILYKPNISLVTNEFSETSILEFTKAITAGGVLIFPQEMEEHLESSTNFFRKLPFHKTNFQQIGDHINFDSTLGTVSIPNANELLMANLEGLQLLSQQFGILEEAFYEPIISFA